MIRIAYVIDKIETPSAGTEKQLLLLLNHLDKSRFEPHLVCLRDSEWLRNNRLPVPVEVLGLESLRSMATIGAMRRFRRYCRLNRVDIVQSFFRDSNIFATVGAWLARVPLIVSSRRFFGERSWHTPSWLLLMRGLARLTDQFIANSRLIADYSIKAERIPADRIHVIYNGLDLDQFKRITSELRIDTRRAYGITDDQVLVGIVANLRPIKNHGLFIEAAARLREIVPQAHFIIAGEGDCRPDIEARIGQLGLGEAVTLTGQIRDTMPLLAAMDIGVLCSHSESLSNAIIEYMAAGIPCVVSEVGGNREAIGGEYGLVFADNDLAGIVRALDKLSTDVQLRKDLGRRGREYAHRTYELRACVGRHESLYEESLHKSQRGRWRSADGSK